jgi:hypothetical protein
MGRAYRRFTQTAPSPTHAHLPCTQSCGPSGICGNWCGEADYVAKSVGPTRGKNALLEGATHITWNGGMVC